VRTTGALSAVVGGTVNPGAELSDDATEPTGPPLHRTWVKDPDRGPPPFEETH